MGPRKNLFYFGKPLQQCELLSLNYQQVVLSHEIEKKLARLSYVCKILVGCDICWNKLYSTELDRAHSEFSPKKIGFYDIWDWKFFSKNCIWFRLYLVGLNQYSFWDIDLAIFLEGKLKLESGCSGLLRPTVGLMRYSVWQHRRGIGSGKTTPLLNSFNHIVQEWNFGQI